MTATGFCILTLLLVSLYLTTTYDLNARIQDHNFRNVERYYLENVPPPSVVSALQNGVNKITLEYTEGKIVEYGIVNKTAFEKNPPSDKDKIEGSNEKEGKCGLNKTEGKSIFKLLRKEGFKTEGGKLKLEEKVVFKKTKGKNIELKKFELKVVLEEKDGNKIEKENVSEGGPEKMKGSEKTTPEKSGMKEIKKTLKTQGSEKKAGLVGGLKRKIMSEKIKEKKEFFEKAEDLEKKETNEKVSGKTNAKEGGFVRFRDMKMCPLKMKIGKIACKTTDEPANKMVESGNEVKKLAGKDENRKTCLRKNDDLTSIFLIELANKTVIDKLYEFFKTHTSPSYNVLVLPSIYTVFVVIVTALQMSAHFYY